MLSHPEHRIAGRLETIGLTEKGLVHFGNEIAELIKSFGAYRVAEFVCPCKSILELERAITEMKKVYRIWYYNEIDDRAIWLAFIGIDGYKSGGLLGDCGMVA